jgi:hypothetical protein
LIREQAFGEALDANELEGLGRYEVHCMSRPYVATIEKPKPKDVSSGYISYRTEQPGDWKTY